MAVPTQSAFNQSSKYLSSPLEHLRTAEHHLQVKSVVIVKQVSQSVAVLQVGNGVSITTTPSSMTLLSISILVYSYIVLRVVPVILLSI